MFSEKINKLIAVLDHDEDECSILMDEGIHMVQLVRKLCPVDKEVILVTQKNNQNLSFNVWALHPIWTPLSKLIWSRLIFTTHTSHITLDKAILLYVMIGKRKVDTSWIIYNNIIDSVKPFKGL